MDNRMGVGVGVGVSVMLLLLLALLCAGAAADLGYRANAVHPGESATSSRRAF